MKSINEWITELPLPVWSKAIEERRSCGWSNDDMLYSSIYEALGVAFRFGGTKDGREYWEKIRNGYKSKEIYYEVY